MIDLPPEEEGFLPERLEKKLEKKKCQLLLEGYVEAATAPDDLTSAKSLTDDDLEELKGCLDLGFGFSYDDNKQNHHKSPEVSSVKEDSSPPPPTTTTLELFFQKTNVNQLTIQFSESEV
ncbi:unnamed protein product [Microthlaspi erraticum]|uniref:Uncharacterized protein n=1 Tax=Microthlaspi erraticum TaxID=1685480 RepID=A0A6D2I8F2_9BRAS|nr:unnamed protein product [Microthlaspi erraticum]